MLEPIVVVDYNPEWASTFVRLRDLLAESLRGLPVEIEHVGSTSVPGAAAKPIIDIDVAVQAEDDVNRAIELLSRAGYRHEGDLGVKGREAFESPRGSPDHHLYVVVLGNSEYTRHLLFRDYLKRHPEEVRRYSNLKKLLAAKFRDDRDGYSEAKTESVEEILRKASG